MKRGGFTLIELMIVVACLGLGVTGGWAGLSTLRRATTADRQLLRATTALESEMDRVRAAFGAGRELPSGSFRDPELEGVTVNGLGKRLISRTGPRLARVVLGAEWRTPTGQPRSATLVSLVERGRP